MKKGHQRKRSRYDSDEESHSGGGEEEVFIDETPAASAATSSGVIVATVPKSTTSERFEGYLKDSQPGRFAFITSQTAPFTVLANCYAQRP